MTTQEGGDFEKVRGAEAIGRVIGENSRRVYALAQKRLIPVWREGGILVTTRARLREHYEKKTHGV